MIAAQIAGLSLTGMELELAICGLRDASKAEVRGNLTLGVVPWCRLIPLQRYEMSALSTKGSP